MSGKRYFVDRVCGKKQQPGRKALTHEKDAHHIHLTSKNVNIGVYIKEAAENLAKEKSTGKEKYILKYLDNAYFLFKEQIPHTTKFEKLMSLACRMSDEVDIWTKNRDHNATYRSMASVTEFLELFEKQIGEDTKADLSTSLQIYRSWTILADETSVHNHGILSIYARYISYKTGNVNECMLDCKPIEGRTTAVNLFKLINESVEKVGLDKCLCRSVSFDGARNMSSEQEGVLGYLKRFWNENILLEHCRAHRLALVCKTVANEVPLVREVIELINAVYKVFQKSNRKVDLLKGKCLEDEMKVKTLIKAAMIRWLTTGQSVDRMIDLIVQVLECPF